MTSTADPIQVLRELRGEVAEPSFETQLIAREAMFAARTPGRGRLVAAVAICLLAIVGVIAVMSPWAHTQSAEAAVDDLAQTAAAQPTLKIGPRDWIITRYTTLRSWTQDLTQEKLDQLSARSAAVMEAANSSGHYMRANGSPISKSEQAKIDRANQRHADRVRAGVKLSDLPTTHVTAWVEAPYQEAHSASGIGGGGGGSNDVHYESADQKAAAAILQRAGIGGRNADPTDFGGSEIASLPARAVGNQNDVEGLSKDLGQMRAQLTKWPATGGLGEDIEAGSALDLFAKTSGVVSSPYATPEQRAAAIRLVASLPGVTIDQHAKDAKGRAGIGMSMDIPGGTMELIFDQSDSQLLGMLVKIADPKAFVGKSYAGSGKNRVDVIPPFDSATIAVSYQKPTVSRGGPPCTPTFCVGGRAEMSPSFLKRMRERAHAR